jgi:hypothetical protein
VTRFASIHEDTRYEVLIRGVRSRAEAEAIVLAVERLPASGSWLPTDAPEIPAPPTIPEDSPYLRDESDNTGDLKNGEALP